MPTSAPGSSGRFRQQAMDRNITRRLPAITGLFRWNGRIAAEEVATRCWEEPSTLTNSASPPPKNKGCFARGGPSLASLRQIQSMRIRPISFVMVALVLASSTLVRAQGSGRIETRTRLVSQFSEMQKQWFDAVKRKGFGGPKPSSQRGLRSLDTGARWTNPARGLAGADLHGKPQGLSCHRYGSQSPARRCNR